MLDRPNSISSLKLRKIKFEELNTTNTFECEGNYYLVAEYENEDDGSIKVKVAVNLETGKSKHGFNKNAILRIVDFEMKEKRK